MSYEALLEAADRAEGSELLPGIHLTMSEAYDLRVSTAHELAKVQLGMRFRANELVARMAKAIDEQRASIIAKGGRYVVARVMTIFYSADALIKEMGMIIRTQEKMIAELESEIRK